MDIKEVDDKEYRGIRLLEFLEFKMDVNICHAQIMNTNISRSKRARIMKKVSSHM